MSCLSPEIQKKVHSRLKAAAYTQYGKQRIGATHRPPSAAFQRGQLRAFKVGGDMRLQARIGASCSGATQSRAFPITAASLTLNGIRKLPHGTMDACDSYAANHIVKGGALNIPVCKLGTGWLTSLRAAFSG